VQAKPQPAAERLEGGRPKVTGRKRQPQQVIEVGDVAELLGLVLIVGLGDGADNVAEADRVGHREKRQPELARPLGEFGCHGRAAGAQPDDEPARADPGQPLGEVHLVTWRCPDTRSVRQEQFARSEVVPRRRQIGRVRPGDLAVQPASAPDQRQLQPGTVQQPSHGHGHWLPAPSSSLSRPGPVRSGPGAMPVIPRYERVQEVCNAVGWPKAGSRPMLAGMNAVGARA
jgi:hypothetical protein